MNPFLPHELPIRNFNWQNLIGPIGQANAAIARYDGLLQSLINPGVLLSPMTTNEAVLSSKIEGTQASLGEVLEHDAGLDTDKSSSKYEDIQEIVNYRKALRFAEQELAHRPISLSFIKHLHSVLMNSVRGRDKSPGQFRKEQNWIGKRGTPIEQARFVPPSPLVLNEYLEKWEKYLQGNEIDPLIQMAVIHAQFEIIHPFMDGNGRIGRLLIPLFLYSKKCLRSPMFYLSEYLELHRADYYDALLFITNKNSWQEWIEFFLKAVIHQSEINIEKAKQILALYEQLKEKFISITHSQHAVPALDAFFISPIINSTNFIELTSIPNKVTANDILRKLVKKKVILTLRKGKGRSPSIYALPDLVNITEGKRIM